MATSFGVDLIQLEPTFETTSPHLPFLSNNLCLAIVGLLIHSPSAKFGT